MLSVIKDKQTVRELAKKYMSLVCTPRQERMFARFRDTNDLKQTRPPRKSYNLGTNRKRRA